MGGRANPIVTRFYREPSEVDSCAQAVRLLLDFTKKKQMATRPGGHDDAEVLKMTAPIQRLYVSSALLKGMAL